MAFARVRGWHVPTTTPKHAENRENTQDFRETRSVSLKQRQHFPTTVHTSDEKVRQNESHRDQAVQDEFDVNGCVNIELKGARYSRRKRPLARATPPSVPLPWGCWGCRR